MTTTIATNPKVATHRLAASVVAALSLLVAACSSIVLETDNDRVGGSGQVTTETRSITEFERIVLAGEGSVLLEAGPDGQIEIETDDNLLTHLRTDVSGDTLTISTEPGTDIEPTSGVTYRLGCPEITAVVLSGAGTIDLATCAATGRLDIELPGAGTILAPDLDASTVRASLPGAGSIVATGRVDLLEVVLAGAGEFDGRDLRADDASVDSLGVGMTTVWATDELFVSLTGVGSVGYYGEPQVSSSVTGVGTIEALGPK
jgi:hypothetical protein